jgi:hypothetical protein
MIGPVPLTVKRMAACTWRAARAGCDGANRRKGLLVYRTPGMRCDLLVMHDTPADEQVRAQAGERHSLPFSKRHFLLPRRDFSSWRARNFFGPGMICL